MMFRITGSCSFFLGASCFWCNWSRKYCPWFWLCLCFIKHFSFKIYNKPLDDKWQLMFENGLNLWLNMDQFAFQILNYVYMVSYIILYKIYCPSDVSNRASDQSHKESNTSTCPFHLDLLLSIWRDGQLRHSIYDKRDDFNFYITNFQSLRSNIWTPPAYGFLTSQITRYTRDCLLD